MAITSGEAETYQMSYRDLSVGTWWVEIRVEDPINSLFLENTKPKEINRGAIIFCKLCVLNLLANCHN